MVLRAFALTALLIAIAPPTLADETCVQTRVTESFVSPDGKPHGPGVVKVCPYWTISPSFRLNKVSFNGRPLGIWMTRAREGGKLPDLSSIETQHAVETADHRVEILEGDARHVIVDDLADRVVGRVGRAHTVDLGGFEATREGADRQLDVAGHGRDRIGA